MGYNDPEKENVVIAAYCLNDNFNNQNRITKRLRQYRNLCMCNSFLFTYATECTDGKLVAVTMKAVVCSKADWGVIIYKAM